MFAIIVGIIFVGFTAFSVIPALPLNWGPQVIEFLKRSLPVFAAFIGLICLFIGAADIKDKKEAKKEDAEKTEENK